MKFTIEAACSCNIGKIRKNNEDNFYFDGRCLEMENTGLKHPVSYDGYIKPGLCFAVFDGMGGENFGDIASFTAAKETQQIERSIVDFFVPEKKYLERLVMRLNSAVVDAQKELYTTRMGTTMVAVYFSSRYIYVCNVGDSRAYRLRNGEFMQLSMDHTIKHPSNAQKKAPLAQYLGINPDEILIDPYIAKGKLENDDMYLLCSDGLTDMLTNFEISDIMLQSKDAETCVQKLISAALEHGGRDNITAIVCKIL